MGGECRTLPSLHNDASDCSLRNPKLLEGEGEGIVPSLERTYVHVGVRDKLRAVARKGWMGSGNAFDSVVMTRSCFKSTRPTRVGNDPPSPSSRSGLYRPPCSPNEICEPYLSPAPAHQASRKRGEPFRLFQNGSIVWYCLSPTRTGCRVRLSSCVGEWLRITTS